MSCTKKEAMEYFKKQNIRCPECGLKMSKEKDSLVCWICHIRLVCAKRSPKELTSKGFMKAIKESNLSGKKFGCNKKETKGAYTFTCGEISKSGKIQLCKACRQLPKEKLKECKYLVGDWCHNPNFLNYVQDKCDWYADEEGCSHFEKITDKSPKAKLNNPQDTVSKLTDSETLY